MGEHTRGPWVCIPQADCRSILIATQHKHGHGIAEVWIDLAPYAESAEANARLISAAPELLEALERVAEACERSAAETCCCPSCWEHPYGDGSGHSSDCAVSAARAAIKKARGEGYFQREHLAGDGGRSAVNKRTT
jgi:hypothetical protein